MLKKNILLIIFCFAFLPIAYCQIPDFSFKNININEGLSQSSVVDIATDDLGFMWFATQDGLNRYDGNNFIQFPAIFDDITSPVKFRLGKIVNTGDHKLWMITAGGRVAVLDNLTQKIKRISHLSKDSIRLPPLSCINADKQGNLWMGTINDGVWVYNKKSNSISTHATTKGLQIFSNAIQAIYNDNSSNTWILTDKGLHYISPKGRKDYLFNISVSSISISNNKDVWVGTLGHGIYRKKEGYDQFEKFKGFDNFNMPANLVISCVLTDNKGQLWAGTYGNGLYIINPKEAWVKHITADRKNPFSLGFNDVLCISKDSRGDIWIGTDGGGISYYNRHFNNFSLLTAGNVPNEISIEQVRSIKAKKGGNVYLGTSSNGVTLASPAAQNFKTFHLPAFKKGISNYDRVVSLQTDADNDVWLGTNGNGLLILDSNLNGIKKWFTTESSNQKDRLSDNTIWCMLPGKNNTNWLGTNSGGLLLVDKKNGVIKIMNTHNGKDNNRIRSNNIRSLIQINDSLLCIGFEKAGIQYYNIQSEKFIDVEGTTLYQYFQGQTVLKSLYWDKTFLWMGTAGSGIIVYHPQNQLAFVIDKKRQNLPNNTVYGILPQNDTTVWVSMNKGIARITYGKNKDLFRLKNIQPYNVKDGLQSNEFNTGAFDKSDDGILFFGGIKGINSIDPNRVLQNENTTPVYLTGFSVSDRPYTSDTLITYKQLVKLSSRQNSVSFNYAALNFVSPEKLHYEYKLENYDANWIEADNRNYAAYTNLPSGTYTFMVRIAGEDEHKSNGLTLIIASPFWSRWWFILGVAALVAGVLFLFYRSSINQLLKIQQVRNRISADLHDDIGSRLTNIQLLSAITKQQFNNGNTKGKQLDQIQEQVQLSAEALDEIVWNMKVKDDAVNNITARMRRYASEVFEADNITYRITIKEPLEGELAMEKRRDLFLVYREILNNIRKHAHAKNAAIEIDSDKKNISIHITDDGVGFDINQLTNRNGLANIKERISRWHGTVTIKSSPGNGTNIMLLLPFEKTSPIKRMFWGLAKT